MTNGDKIRNMSDEELAVTLQPTRYFCLFDTMMIDKSNVCADDLDCTDCVLKWLKEEVHEDG